MHSIIHPLCFIVLPVRCPVSRAHILSLALVLSTVGGDTPASAAPPKVGERHPYFTLPGITDGKPVALSDFRGKKVLLIQFASW